MSGKPKSAANAEFDREQWEADVRLRERDLAIKEREQDIKDREVQAKIDEQKRSRWTNPPVLAVLAAALAASGNAAVALINGILQRSLEESRATAQNSLEEKKADAQQLIEEAKAEAARILEVIKTNDPDKAAVNLDFLLSTGLITNIERKASLAAFLERRNPGQGPALPGRDAEVSRTTTVSYDCQVKDGQAAPFVLKEIESFLASNSSARFSIRHGGHGGTNPEGIWIDAKGEGGFLIEVTAGSTGNSVVIKIHGTTPRTKSDEQIISDKSSEVRQLVPSLVRSKLRELVATPACAT